MLTTTDILAMPDPEACATFETMAADYYGDQWKTALAVDLDRSYPAVYGWLEKRPPVWALMLLDAKIRARDLEKAVKLITSGFEMAMDLTAE